MRSFMTRRLKKKGQRGFSILEVMISMAILAVGILGVAKMQVFAAAQNGLARRTSKASAIARDFVEMASRWNWADPRLATLTPCGVVPTTIMEGDLGNEKIPLIAMDFTASPAAAPNATNEGAQTDGLVAGNTVYLGRAMELMGYPEVQEQGYQLMWTVQHLDTNPGALDPACDAKQVTVVVRYPTGAGQNYRNLVTTFIQYNADLLVVGGVQEQI